MSGPQRVVLGAWLAMIGLATARSLTSKQGLPQPGVFLFSALLFSGYYVLAGIGPLGTLVAVFAIGTDFAVVAAPYIKDRVPPPGSTLLDRLNGNLTGLNQSQATAGTLRPGQPS